MPQINVPQKPVPPPRVEKKNNKSSVENLAHTNDPGVHGNHDLDNGLWNIPLHQKETLPMYKADQK
eukprot:2985860-Ditylum_brightwellii.AAC.1